MSLPETIWWCDVYENTTERPESCRSKPVMHVRCQELRVAGRDDLLIRREDYEALIGEVGLRLLRRVNRGELLTPERATTEMLNVFDAALAAAEGGETDESYG